MVVEHDAVILDQREARSVQCSVGNRGRSCDSGSAIAVPALLDRLARAVIAPPVNPEPVGRFAERVLGSAHALDADRPLSGLLFGAARALGDVPEGRGASWRREVWAAVVLVRDELSSIVLTFGLRGDPDHPHRARARHTR